MIDELRPYEILVRYGPDGKFQGSHMILRRFVEIDGKVILDQLQLAEPVDAEMLKGILSTAQADAFNRVAEVEKERDEALAKIESE